MCNNNSRSSSNGSRLWAAAGCSTASRQCQQAPFAAISSGGHNCKSGMALLYRHTQNAKMFQLNIS